MLNYKFDIIKNSKAVQNECIKNPRMSAHIKIPMRISATCKIEVIREGKVVQTAYSENL